MIGTLSEETEVKVPTSKAWAVCCTLELGRVVTGKIAESFIVTEGDGGTGIVKTTLKPGLIFTYFIEKFTEVDNDNKIKETEILEVLPTGMGCNFYTIKMEIKDGPEDSTGSSCIVKLTLEYDVKGEFAANVSFLTAEFLVGVMNVVNKHLLTSD